MSDDTSGTPTKPEAGYKRGYEDAKGIRKGPATLNLALRVIDTYVNFPWNKDAYLRGYCDSACARSDIDCMILVQREEIE